MTPSVPEPPETPEPAQPDAELPVAEFAFPGPLRDRLVAAILDGRKTTTTALAVEYDIEGEALPEVGSRQRVVDSAGRAVAVIETVRVRLCPLGEVPWEHARDEGEGHEDVAQWRRGHERFWRSEEMTAALGAPLTVDDGTVVVLEEFRLVRRLDAAEPLPPPPPGASGASGAFGAAGVPGAAGAAGTPAGSDTRAPHVDATVPPSAPVRARRRDRGRGRAAMVIAAAAAALLALAAGSAVGAVVRPSASPAPAPRTSSPAATPTPTPAATRATPAAVVPASPIRDCTVDGPLADPGLGTAASVVLNAETGEVLLDRRGDVPAQTASVMKLATAAAALRVLGPDYRASTTVLRGPDAGTIVLRGGGDLTLSRLPSGQESVYPGAAHLDDLAAQVRQARAADPELAQTPVSRIIVDSSLFGGTTWEDTWPATERQAGWLSHITTLQVDADRADPTVFLSPRGEDPVGRAAEAFAAFFPGATIDRDGATGDGSALAEVSSPPVSELLAPMLVPSDNTLAEMLARLVAIESGEGNTLADVDPAIRSALEDLGLDTEGMTFADGSGMSRNNAVAPELVAALLQRADADEDGLGPIVGALPVAGESGTLAYSNRFTGDNQVARGKVRAKTGSITTAYTLAGFVDAEDGSRLIAVIFATDRVSEASRQPIDTLATAYYRCGNRLANSPG
ncbi:D-alanyl-D-alanine carboxypeptidase/D-alanyl-D-alanine endopeptidase [Mycetocola reblochoni]|uniref:D-alanyl-D-alanine carboxypeptidase/D-alanyl-D-alanine endopeptidase n=2 Tax=Mycetocola reblochoni TaxID=331618 RepID=UPI0016042A59|nr:D-alanyl-D-alanine carboxypeptidase/D-alanyl-D-alanine-endopeptidase [Mycetocola reblochoni]